MAYKHIQNHVKQYTIQLVHQNDVTIGVVCHLMNYDIKNEFDPLMIERIKNCMKQLLEKDFIVNLSDEIILSSMMMD